jgi:hypothetical protein
MVNLLSNNVTVVCVDTSLSNQTITIQTERAIGRIVYIKNLPLSNAVNPVFLAPPNLVVPSYDTLNLSNQTFGLVTTTSNDFLQWNAFTSFPGSNLFSTSVNPSPGSVSVSLPSNSTYFFVDTTSQSKVILLPETTDWQGRFITIKDINGNAETNPIYISSPSGYLIDNFHSLPISHNYGSMDLYAVPNGNAFSNRWIILNYYGNIVP